MSFLTNFLPQTPGLLPKWQLLVSTIAIFNSLQNFYTTKLTKRIFANRPEQVSALQARTFAVWTATAAVVRFYCAYHIAEKTIYDITIWTYVFALSHFVSELVIFRTTGFNAGVMSPFVVASTSLIWMWTQYDHYVVS